MPDVVFDPAALIDVDGIYDHIGRTLKSPQAADRTIDRIQEACRSHANQPQIVLVHREMEKLVS
jgi:plasmid stabilization system protein ParE